MKTATRVALAGALVLGLATAAEAQSPQIPTPANPFPANPVATDGSPLPLSSGNVANGGGLTTGRSAFVDPVGGMVGTGVGAAGTVVGTGVGVARGALDTGLDATGTLVNGGVNAAGDVVR